MSDIIGKMKCFVCSAAVQVKRSPKNRHIVATCSWQKGGCGCQFFSRTADCDELVMKRIQPLETEKKEQAANSEPAKKAEPESGAMFGFL